MFCFNNVVSEDFIGLIPIRKVVGSSLSAPNIMEALEQFFYQTRYFITRPNVCLYGHNQHKFRRKGRLKMLLGK